MFVHVGLPKTASTSLQDLLFSQHPQLNYLGIPHLDNDIATLMREVIYSPPGAFDVNDGVVKLKSAIDVLDDSKKLLISEEKLGNATRVSRAIKFHRLKEVLDKANIPLTFLIVIREPLDYAKSLYLWDMRCIEFGENRFFVPISRWLNRRMKNFNYSNLSVINSGKIVGECLEFSKSKSKVHVIPFETLKLDVRQFTDRFSQILEIDSGTSYDLFTSDKKNSGLTDKGLKYISLFTRENSQSKAQIAEKIVELFSNELSLQQQKDIEDIFCKNVDIKKSFFEGFSYINTNLKESSSRAKVTIGSDFNDEIIAKTEEGLRWLDKEFALELSKFGYTFTT